MGCLVSGWWLGLETGQLCLPLLFRSCRPREGADRCRQGPGSVQPRAPPPAREVPFTDLTPDLWGPQIECLLVGMAPGQVHNLVLSPTSTAISSISKQAQRGW